MEFKPLIIEGDVFDRIRDELRPKFRYDTHARLFAARDGTAFPPVTIEKRRRDRHMGAYTSLSAYGIYARVNGDTRLMEHGIQSALWDLTKAVDPIPGVCGCLTGSGVAYHFDRQLEVVARRIDKRWDILLLRDVGERQGYIHPGLLR